MLERPIDSERRYGTSSSEHSVHLRITKQHNAVNSVFNPIVSSIHSIHALALSEHQVPRHPLKDGIPKRGLRYSAESKV
jgi:hypothetical protein